MYPEAIKNGADAVGAKASLWLRWFKSSRLIEAEPAEPAEPPPGRVIRSEFPGFLQKLHRTTSSRFISNACLAVIQTVVQ